MKNSLLKKQNGIGQILIILALMVLVSVIMLFLNPDSFFSVKNAKSMLFQFPEFGILSFGMMFCMISGGIDLSLVGIMNLSGMTASFIVLSLIPAEENATTTETFIVIILAVIASLAVGALCGLFNGFLIGFFRIPAMLVTLCSLQLFTGIVYGVTGGSAVTGMCSAFKSIANGTIGDTSIPWVLPIFAVTTVIVALVLHRSKFGKELFFIGTSEKVSEYSGIRILKSTILTYMTSGILGAVAGFLMTSHLNAAKSSNGSTYTLLSVLAVVLGGVHPNGGKGNVVGVTLSVILIQMISNSFTLLRISQDVKNLANGVLLVLTLVTVVLLKKISEKK